MRDVKRDHKAMHIQCSLSTTATYVTSVKTGSL